MPFLAACRFLAGSDSDDSGDERRVVKSAKDKALEELAHVCDDLRVGFQLSLHQLLCVTYVYVSVEGLGLIAPWFC
jgi:hypothetical protein